MKRIIIISIAFALNLVALAQNVTQINGPTAVTIGSTVTYNIMGFTCANPYDFSYDFWIESGPAGGTIVSHDGSRFADVTFTQCGVYVIGALRPCQSFVAGYETITVTDPSISTPSVSTSPASCASSNIAIMGSGCVSPSTVVWYDNIAGTGTPLGTGSPLLLTPTTSQTYYAFCHNTTTLCSSTIPASITTNIIPLPILSAVPTSICQNAPSFTVSATPSGGSFTLDGAANFGFVNPSSLSVGTHTICYTNSGCSTCETFTVNTAPSIGLFTGASSVCAGQSVPLFLAVSGGTNWSVSPSSSISPSSGVSTGATINLSASPTSSLTYTLTVENPSTGCQTTGTKSISVNPLPVVSISGSGCINQATSFTLSASGATSYLWTASPGPNPIPNNLSSITVNPSVATTYTVVGTSTGCNDAESFTTPTCFPVEFLSFSGDVLANGSHHLEWNVSENQVSHYEVERRQGNGDFEKIASLNSNSASQGHYSHDIQVPQAGISMYRIKVVDMDGSISYSENMVSLASNSLWELKIYPNPVKDVLHMEVKTSGEYEVQIFNSLGELVYFMTKSSEDGTFFLDCSNWAAGIYECKVSSEYGEEVRKLVVE